MNVSSRPLTTSAGQGSFHPFDLSSADELAARGALKWDEVGVIGAWIAEMDFLPAPEIVDAIRAAAPDHLGYLTKRDADAVRRACASFQRDYFGWEVDPAWIEPIPDGSSGIDIAIEELTEPGEGVVILTPAYMPFLTRPEQLGRRAIEVPMARDADRFVLDLDALEKAFTAGGRLLLLCNPHNPIGRVYEPAELGAIAEVVERHGARVLADEIHSPLVFPGSRHTPYAHVSETTAAHSATLISTAKAWNIPGAKCAQLVLSARADRVTWRRRELAHRYEPAHLGAIAAQAAYDHARPWLAEAVDYLDGNRRVLADELARRLPAAWCAPIAGTFLAWLDLTALGLPTPAAAWLHSRARVKVTDGRECGAGAGWVRFNFAMPRPVLLEAIDRIAASLPT